MSPKLDSLERLATNKTKAILIAHLFGGFVDLNPIEKLCKQRNWMLIEDCAQAYDSSQYRGHGGLTLVCLALVRLKVRLLWVERW